MRDPYACRQVMGSISWIVDSLLYEEAVAEAEEEQRLTREQATLEQMDEDEEDGLDDQVKLNFGRGGSPLHARSGGDAWKHSIRVVVKYQVRPFAVTGASCCCAYFHCGGES